MLVLFHILRRGVSQLFLPKCLHPQGNIWGNKAGYTAAICGRVGRGGNARFPTFQLERDRPLDRQTDGRTKPLIEMRFRNQKWRIFREKWAKSIFSYVFLLNGIGEISKVADFTTPCVYIANSTFIQLSLEAETSTSRLQSRHQGWDLDLQARIWALRL